jgi:hypothetical protein
MGNWKWGLGHWPNRTLAKQGIVDWALGKQGIGDWALVIGD